MRIGIDVRELKKGSHTGLGRILEEFLACVSEKGKEYTFVLFGNQHTDIDRLPGGAEKVIQEEGWTPVWDHLVLPFLLRKNKVDVFYSPYIKTPFWRVCPYVNTVSDTIPLEAPKYSGFKGLLEKVHFKVCAYLFARRAAKVMTISGYALNMVCQITGVGREKVEAIYPAIGIGGEAPKDTERSPEDDKYLLYVGNLKPHKNVKRLIEAYTHLSEDIKTDYKLYIAGGDARRVEELKAEAVKIGVDAHVVMLGGVPEEELGALYAKAACFVFPSVAEGFGIPPLEAMKSGVPVVSSCRGPMTEILQDAAVYFDPLQPRDMARAIEDVLRDGNLRQECIEKGTGRAAYFSGYKMKEAMMKLIEIAGSPKVLCASTDFPPLTGGISTFVHNLWSGVSGQGRMILTSRPSYVPEEIDESLDIVREKYPLGTDLISRSLRTIAVVWHVWRQNCIRNVRKNHCAQIISSGLAGLIAKIFMRTPYIVYAYSADILEFGNNILTKWIIEKVISGSDKVVVCSRFAKALIVGHDLAPKEKVIVVTPGVDPARFSSAMPEEDVRLMFGIPEGKKILLSVSRLAERKGHSRVIEVLPEVLADQEDVVYVIAGDGEKRTALEEMVKEKGLTDNVIFTGRISDEDIAALYNACYAFILLPQYRPEAGDIEGFGIVFLEANACHKPVIAGDTGGVSEAVVNDETGILVDPEDVSAVKSAILSLLKDPEYANRLGEQGYQRVLKDFNWSSRVEELKKYF